MSDQGRGGRGQADVPSARGPAADAAEDATGDAWAGGTPEGRRAVDLLWGEQPAPTRGPRPKITLEEVLAAAVDLADSDGWEALSMRGLARRLGVGTMSLYTYVPGKSELFELMIDRAYGERRRPEVDLPWRERYEEHAREALAMYRRHPWLVHSNLWRLPPGPHVLDISEDLLTVGRDAGLPLGVGARVSELLESYVFGIARGEIADQAQAARSGESADDYWAARASVWTTYFDPARYPSLFATWEAGFYDDDVLTQRLDVDFALGLLLESIERLVAQGGAER